jgi:peptidoglycan/xylan/chitin deacetylase (PgdA/CDA1 family)
MHEIYNNSFLAFREILKELDKQGYEFVTVSELLGDQLEAGKKFYKR